MEERFLIKPPQEKESCYRFILHASGLDIGGAYLTCEIFPNKSNDRNILIINGRATVIKQLNETERRGYDALYREIEPWEGSDRRIFAATKNIVSRLEENTLKLKNVKVVVHKLGPVPVYILPEKYKVTCLGMDVEAQIGIFPVIKNIPSVIKRKIAAPSFLVGDKEEFLQSLKYGLDVMFQRYLEDIGECMFDIEHHLNVHETFERAKEMEDIIGKSLKTKIAVLSPPPKTTDKPYSTKIHQISFEIFERQVDWIFAARYARQFAMFFLNELYKKLGVKSVSSHYFNGFSEIKEYFNAMLEDGWYEDTKRDFIQISLLNRALQAYHHNDLDEILELDSDILWTKRFLQFAKFLATLNDRGIASIRPTSGRLFISYHHEVPIAETLKAQIENYLNDKFGDQLAVISFKNREPGIKFRPLLKSHIWQSDLIKGIIPKDTAEISSEEDKDYLWIAREVEHGILLGKRVIYLVEDGCNENKVLNDFKNENMGFLEPRVRTQLPRTKKVIKSYKDALHCGFFIKGTDRDSKKIPTDVKDTLNREAMESIKCRHENIIIGLFKQLTPKNMKFVVNVQKVAEYPETKKKIVTKLFNNKSRGKKRFNNAWRQVRQRAIIINDITFHLISKSGKTRNTKYTGAVNKILKQMHPSMKKEEINAWQRKILDRIT
jgi:hypothetical protein